MTGRPVLVLGASRGIGLAAVRAALARGLEVRAVARTAGEAARAFADKGLPAMTWVQGDIRDPAAVAPLLVGRPAVLWTPGVAPGREPVRLFSDSMRVLIAAMQTAGARRLLAVTGIGAGDSRGAGGFFYEKVLTPLILKETYADKDRAEALIRASGLDWTIVRPGFLTNGRAGAPLIALTRKETYRAGAIARASVAEWMLDQIDRIEYVGAAPLLINAR